MTPDLDDTVRALSSIFCPLIPAKIDRLFAHCLVLVTLFDKIRRGAHSAAPPKFPYSGFDYVPAKEPDRRNYCDW